MFETNLYRNSNTHFMFNQFSRKSYRLWDYLEKCNTAHALFVLDK